MTLTKEAGTRKFYIIMTSRKLKTGIKEYIAVIKYSKGTIALGILCSRNGTFQG